MTQQKKNTLKMNGGKAIVEAIKKEGVTKIFGVPGESYLNVLDAMYNDENIDFISARQEGGAAFMAESYAKATGNVGVCMATRGPGATNLSIGLHTAMQDSTPVVAFIGQIERYFKYREAFQEVNYESFFNDICKWVIEIDNVDRIPELVHRAFHVARTGRPGPVVVSIPEDMQDELTEFDAYQPLITGITNPDVASVKQAVELLKESTQPVLIAGGGVILSKATDELVKLSETLQIPVATAFRRFHAFPNDHKNYAGSLGLGANPELVEYIQNADLVLAIGTKFSQMTTDNYTIINEKSQLIHVDITPDALGKVYPTTLPIVSDAKAFLKEALNHVKETVNEQRQENVKRANQSYIKYSTPQPKVNAEYADLAAVIEAIQKTYPDDTIITSDAGNFFSWLARYFRYGKDNTYIGPTSGAMGYGMPAAIGAKIAHPDKPVISFSGDGGYMMTMQEFETAVRYNVPIISIVSNNNMYGTIRSHQESRFPNRVVGTQLTNPNFPELARNFGGYGERISTNDDIDEVLQRALKADKPTLIEVVVDPKILSANQ